MKRLFATVCAFGILLPAQAESFKLVCKATVDGKPSFVAVLAIDTDRRTVNGYSATFTPDEIKWHTRDSYGGSVHTLNRLAGTYQSWPESGVSPSIPPLFSCEKAAAPRF
jgi:hypothetical protein